MAEPSEERVLLTNFRGEKLVGVLSKSSTATNNLVIFCHGLAGHKDDFVWPSLAKALSQEINAFRFDFSGNGESEGEFSYSHYNEEVEDLRSVIQHFRNKMYHISAIVGHSKGGNLVLLYAAKYGDVPVVISVAARFLMSAQPANRLNQQTLADLETYGRAKWISVKYPNGTRKQLYITQQQIDERARMDMSVIRSIRSDVFIVHGDSDTTIPVDDASLIFREISCEHVTASSSSSSSSSSSCPSCAKPIPTLRIVHGADHGFFGHEKEVVQLLCDFLFARVKSKTSKL